MNKKILYFTFSIWIIIGVYGLLFFVQNAFGLIDDGELIGTIFDGKPIPFFIRESIGRFYPFDGQEYNIVSLFSHSADAFYFYNFLQYVVVVVLLTKILQQVLNNQRSIWIPIAIGMFILSPGFATAWFRLFVPERGAVFFLVLFLFFYMRFQKKEKLLYLFAGLFFVNIALYYKEPIFIMVGLFSFVHLLFGFKILSSKQKWFDILIMLSSLVWVGLYYFIVFVHKGETLYNAYLFDSTILYIKYFISTVLADPFAMLLLLLLGVRLFLVIVKKVPLSPIYDAMLASSSIYILIFQVLNMFAFHYLLPLYVFGIPALFYWIKVEKYYKFLLIKLGIIGAFGVFIFNTLPIGLHTIAHYKNVPYNFQHNLDFLETYIEKNNDKTKIFLDGVYTDTGIEIYGSYNTYLIYRGVPKNKFEISSTMGSLGFYKRKDKRKVDDIHSGDLLVVTPYSFHNINNKYLTFLEKEYDLVYSAKSSIDVGNYSLQSLLKYVWTMKNKENSNEVLNNLNIVQKSDFYVFEKK